MRDRRIDSVIALKAAFHSNSEDLSLNRHIERRRRPRPRIRIEGVHERAIACHHALAHPTENCAGTVVEPPPPVRVPTYASSSTTRVLDCLRVIARARAAARRSASRRCTRCQRRHRVLEDHPMLAAATSRISLCATASIAARSSTSPFDDRVRIADQPQTAIIETSCREPDRPRCRQPLRARATREPVRPARTTPLRCGRDERSRTSRAAQACRTPVEPGVDEIARRSRNDEDAAYITVARITGRSRFSVSRTELADAWRPKTTSVRRAPPPTKRAEIESEERHERDQRVAQARAGA